jgi:NAD(P)-dependent dehydrogenase (short-subunit alcohol dehydrogenase family)
MTETKNRPVALVTGAGRGIGRGIVLELAVAGFDVAGCDIVFEPTETTTGLFEVQNAVEELPGSVFLPISGDVADLDAHDRILGAVFARFGRLDVLVNNAGVAPLIRADLLETTPASFDRVMGINLRGPFFLTQKAVPRMLKGPAGESGRPKTIIFVTSISAEAASSSRPEYCVSKAGLSMTAKLFADRLAADGLNVYEIRPGIIRTDMTAPVREKYDRLIGEGLVPQGRWGLPEDVGRAVSALALGRFGYATGIILEISGGMNIRRL